MIVVGRISKCEKFGWNAGMNENLNVSKQHISPVFEKRMRFIIDWKLSKKRTYSNRFHGLSHELSYENVLLFIHLNSRSAFDYYKVE